MTGTDPTADWTTGGLLAASSAYWRACAIHAGVRLEIFTLLADQRLRADEVAAALAGDRRGATLLLNALSALGLLHHQGDTYANTPFSRRMLAKDSPEYLGHILRHHHHLVAGWAGLHEAVLSGGPVLRPGHGEEAERESFLLGMHNLAAQIAPQLAAEIDLRGRRRLLDLGGGPGTHAVHFCLANPALTAVICDRPTTEPYARRIVTAHGLAGRVAFLAADFNHDSLGGPYDAAWLSQILHSNSEVQCRRLLAAVADALEPGGLILVHDFLLDDTMDRPLFPALFSLNMLINNPGRSYAEQEVRRMLAEAGVGEIRRLPFQGPNDSSVIAGIVAK